MALSGHIGEPWHTWTPEKIEMSYPVLPIVWVKNTSEEARNCLSLLGKHLLSTSLGTCLESDWLCGRVMACWSYLMCCCSCGRHFMLFRDLLKLQDWSLHHLAPFWDTKAKSKQYRLRPEANQFSRSLWVKFERHSTMLRYISWLCFQLTIVILVQQGFASVSAYICMYHDKLSATTPTYGTMYLCCLARHLAYMVQISRSHMSSHVTFNNHYAATQSPARLQTERHKTCQQFQSIVFSIYLCDVCQCYILTYGVGVHICHWVYIQQSWFSRKKCKYMSPAIGYRNE